MSSSQDRLEKQLFVRNLSYETTEEDLVQVFEGVGPLKNVSIAVDSESKRSKGFGFVKL